MTDAPKKPAEQLIADGPVVRESHEAVSETDAVSEFESMNEEPQLSLPMEFVLFLRDNKKWWLTPILLVMLLITVFAWLSATGASPFIYSIF